MKSNNANEVLLTIHIWQILGKPLSCNWNSIAGSNYSYYSIKANKPSLSTNTLCCQVNSIYITPPALYQVNYPLWKEGIYNHPMSKPWCMQLVHFPKCYWQRWSSCRSWLVWTLPVWRFLLLCTAWKWCSFHQLQGHRRENSQWSPHYAEWWQERTKRMSHSLLYVEWPWNPVVDLRGLDRDKIRVNMSDYKKVYLSMSSIGQLLFVCCCLLDTDVSQWSTIQVITLFTWYSWTHLWVGSWSFQEFCFSHLHKAF